MHICSPVLALTDLCCPLRHHFLWQTGWTIFPLFQSAWSCVLLLYQLCCLLLRAAVPRSTRIKSFEPFATDKTSDKFLVHTSYVTYLHLLTPITSSFFPLMLSLKGVSFSIYCLLAPIRLMCSKFWCWKLKMHIELMPYRTGHLGTETSNLKH